MEYAIEARPLKENVMMVSSNRPIDQSTINLKEPDEVQYWADKFGVSKERLSETVAKVGHSVDAVRRELKGA